MTASIVEFPRDRVRSRDSDPQTFYAKHFLRFREIAKACRDSVTGLPLTEAECDQFAHDFLTRLDAAHAELQRNR